MECLIGTPHDVNIFVMIDIKNSSQQGLRRRGRPPAFDREVALHQAMLTFWRHGYEGTSISDLTREMQISPPSLYAAFGDKRHLFLEAVDRYIGGPDTVRLAIEATASARTAAHDLLKGSVVRFTGKATPSGCMAATSVISCSPSAADVQAEVAAIRKTVEDALRTRIERDIAERILPTETDADALAAHIMAVMQGLSTLARDGAGREKLLGVVDLAMTVWP